MNFPYQPIETRQIGSRVLVIYRWGLLSEETTPKVWQNVELFDQFWNKLWTVNGMENSKYWNNYNDNFVGSRIYNGKLQLILFSGNAYDLNIETGEVKYQSFIK